jgi:hypothetical protein
MLGRGNCVSRKDSGSKHLGLPLSTITANCRISETRSILEKPRSPHYTNTETRTELRSRCSSTPDAAQYYGGRRTRADNPPRNESQRLRASVHRRCQMHAGCHSTGLRTPAISRPDRVLAGHSLFFTTSGTDPSCNAYAWPTANSKPSLV